MERFTHAYRQLVAAHLHHAGVPRDPDQVCELAEARRMLDDARAEMSAARESFATERVGVSDHDVAFLTDHGIDAAHPYRRTGHRR